MIRKRKTTGAPWIFNWVEADDNADWSRHGVEFSHCAVPGSQNPIAFLEGYDWYHGTSNTATIYILRKEALLRNGPLSEPDQILKEVREAVERVIVDRGPLGDRVTRNVFSGANG